MAPPTTFSKLTDLELVSDHGSNSLLRTLPNIIPFLGNTLRTVYLQSLGGTSVLGTPNFVDNFRPLLQLNRLTEVRLNFQQLDFKFTDPDLITVAKAWPYVVEMAFAFRNLPGSPIPHLDTLGVVATHCQFLQRITMPYILGPLADTTFEISAPPFHPLREIRVHAMTWDTVQNRAINSSLRRAFPNLQGAPNEPYAPRCTVHLQVY